jgi:hypothetical protein
MADFSFRDRESNGYARKIGLLFNKLKNILRQITDGSVGVSTFDGEAENTLNETG